MGTETYNRDNLFAGEFPNATGLETIVGTVARGTALGMITASTKCQIVNSTNTDGSQTIYAVAAADVVGGAGGALGPVIYTGELNQAALIFGGSDTFATHKAAARKIGLFFKKII